MVAEPVSVSLEKLLESGGFEIGEIRVDAAIELRHRKDSPTADLTNYESAEAARHLAVYDDAGKYRPLKTAPNLRRGWRLRLRSIAELRLALEYFYPAAIGTWLAERQNALPIVPLRETLGRQTGMYRVVNQITDPQIETLVARTCSDRSCLRRVRWEMELGKPHSLTENGGAVSVPGVIPIWCAEACNLLVAEGRKLVKGGAGE